MRIEEPAEFTVEYVRDLGNESRRQLSVVEKRLRVEACISNQKSKQRDYQKKPRCATNNLASAGKMAASGRRGDKLHKTGLTQRSNSERILLMFQPCSRQDPGLLVEDAQGRTCFFSRTRVVPQPRGRWGRVRSHAGFHEYHQP